MLHEEGFPPFVKNKHTNKTFFKIGLTFKGKNKKVNTDKKCAGGQWQMLPRGSLRVSSAASASDSIYQNTGRRK